MFYQNEIVACQQADQACGFDLHHPAFDAAYCAAEAVLALPESWELNTRAWGGKYRLTIESYDVALAAAKAAVAAFDAKEPSA